MGEVDIIPDASLDGLGTSLSLGGARTRVLLLGSRDARQTLRMHGQTVELSEAAVSIFYRPRDDRDAIAAAGVDHRLTTFQFLDIAMADLGRWMQPLIGQGWTRGEITINGSPWVCFHHPVIGLPANLDLAADPATLERKAFVTHPGPAVADALPASPTVSTGGASSPAEEPVSAPPTSEPESASATPTRPADSTPDAPPTSDPEDPVEAVQTTTSDASEGGGSSTPTEESPMEEELRQTIQLLLAGGLDMADVMEHPTFTEISERASAAGIDVWGNLVRLSGSA